MMREWEIHPWRPERLPEGEARVQSRGPRGAKSPPEGNLEGRGGCISQYIPPLGSVRIQFVEEKKKHTIPQNNHFDKEGSQATLL